MATHPLRMRGATDAPDTVRSGEVRWRYRASLGMTGGLLVLMALWGGLMPFIGSVFGFSPDGLATWHWDLSRGLLAAVPAGAALLAGLALLQLGRVAGLGFGRMGVMVAGLLAVAAGCWFAIGPVAWPVLEGHRYFISVGAYGTFEREIAYALGPGLFLGIMGGLACEFAALQGDPRTVPVQMLAAAEEPAVVPAADATTPNAMADAPTTVGPTATGTEAVPVADGPSAVAPE
jgi:hypothetical protein